MSTKPYLSSALKALLSPPYELSLQRFYEILLTVNASAMLQ